MKINIRQYFSDKTILITGATGFIGKVLLEKLLFEIPQIRKIYVLIRPNGKNIQQRLQKKIISSQIMDRLRSRYGKQFENWISQKVVAISGDLASSTEIVNNEIDEKILEQELQVILHVAATIKFSERLDTAIRLNVLGTLKLLELGKRCKKLECFCHVSTAYANCNQRGIIKEKIFHVDLPNGMTLEEFCAHVLQLGPPDIQKISDWIIPKMKFANSYTFTKWMAEQLIKKNRGNIPTVIVRPSIVACALKHPFPGLLQQFLINQNRMDRFFVRKCSSIFFHWDGFC